MDVQKLAYSLTLATILTLSTVHLEANMLLDAPQTEAMGILHNNQRHGPWTVTLEDGRVATGSYEDGTMTGEWKVLWPHGRIEIGGTKDNRRQGIWEVTWPDGSTATGPYVSGERHGEWSATWSDGRTESGYYVQGKKHGMWTTPGPNASMETGNYNQGIRDGPWSLYLAAGVEEEGLYVDGERHGLWTMSPINVTTIGILPEVHESEEITIMVPTELGVSKSTELEGATMCIRSSSWEEIVLQRYLSNHKVLHDIISFKNPPEARDNYIEGRCDAYAATESEIALSYKLFNKMQPQTILRDVALLHGQAFMIPKTLGVHQIQDLDGASVCVAENTPFQTNTVAYLQRLNVEHEMILLATPSEALSNYKIGRCDVYTDDITYLRRARDSLPIPEDHQILTQPLLLSRTTDTHHLLAGMLVRQSLGVTAIKELDGASFCLVAGAPMMKFALAALRRAKVEAHYVVLESYENAESSYLHGHCDVYASDMKRLHEFVATLPPHEEHVFVDQSLPGHMTGEVHYIHGLQEGPWSLHSEDGEVWGEGGTVDKNGRVQGVWEFGWTSGRVERGRIVDGKREGVWLVRWSDGVSEAGRFKDGVRSGHWSVQWPTGASERGNYENNARVGTWTIEHPDGHLASGDLVDGKRQGPWEITWSDGTISQGHYEAGKKEGDWSIVWPDGFIERGRFVGGKRGGTWRMRRGVISASGTFSSFRPDGDWVSEFRESNTDEGSEELNQYGVILRAEDGDFEVVREGRSDRRGYFMGHWAEHRYDGDFWKGMFSRGMRVGVWLRRDLSGSTMVGGFASYSENGMWQMRDSSGNVDYGPMESGVRHGDWTRFLSSGVVEYGRYIEGKRVGVWGRRLPDGSVISWTELGD